MSANAMQELGKSSFNGCCGASSSLACSMESRHTTLHHKLSC